MRGGKLMIADVVWPVRSRKGLKCPVCKETELLFWPGPLTTCLLIECLVVTSWDSCCVFTAHFEECILEMPGDVPGVQWLRIRLPTQRTWARPLAQEDPTCRGATKPTCHNYWARMPGAHAPPQEKPLQGKALSSQLEKVQVKQRRPSTAYNK